MNNQLSKNLRDLRHAKGYTQAEVAEKLNINPQTVSRWETGIALPDVMLLPDIAEIYCVTIDDLYKEHSVAYANYAQRLAAVYEASRELEDFVRADMEYKKLIKREAYTTEDLRIYGIMHQFMMNDCRDKALQLFDKVIERGAEVDEQTFYSTKQQRAYLLTQIGEGKKVVEEQKRIVQKRDCHPKEWVVLIAAYYCEADYESAYNYFKKAIGKFEYVTELYIYGGDICYEMKRYEEAFGYWDKAIELDDTYTAPIYSKGFAYEKLGEYKKAYDVWNELAGQLEKRGMDIEAKTVQENVRRCEEKVR